MLKPTKNYDLIWAREHANLTQKEAAERFEVHVGTVSRWETGAVPVPKRKWAKLLKLLDLTAADLPKRLKYDALGYPLGFDQTPFEDEEDNTAEESALEKIEGEEHPFRARERCRLAAEMLGGPEHAKEELAVYDERERLCLAKDGADLAG